MSAYEAVCLVDGCESGIRMRRGMCQTHYRRWQLRGPNADLTERRRTSRPAPERFWAKVLKTETCWEWLANKSTTGYGRFTSDGKRVQAHRWAYESLVGPIPEGLQLDHLCRNRACVNPEHLEPVTGRENVLRGTAPSAINARKTHCPQGHELPAEVSGRDRDCSICRLARNAKQAEIVRRETVYTQLLALHAAWEQCKRFGALDPETMLDEFSRVLNGPISRNQLARLTGLANQGVTDDKSA